MRSHDSLQGIFRALDGLSLACEPEEPYRILAATPEYLHATHTDATIVGRPLFEIFPDPPTLPDASGVRSLRASFARVLQTRESDAMAVLRYDVRARDAGAGVFEERYWSPRNSPVLTADGEVDFIMHHVEEATAKSNRNAVAILESIGEGFFTLDRQWRFDYVNLEAHRILGIEPGALTGRMLWEVYPGLQGTEFERTYTRTMVERRQGAFTAFYANQGAWYEVSTFPAPEGISVYFRDVTAQKKLQEDRDALAAESERQRAMYETALNSTPDFFFVFDLQHRAVYANDAFMTKWGVADVHGKRWCEFGVEAWQADLHDGELDQVISSQAPLRGEVPFTGANGESRVYEYIFSPVLGADSEVVAVAGTTRDVTERQASEAAAREQSRLLSEVARTKDEFLATLAHELRNPLAPLRNSIELLRRTTVADEAATRIHAVMERQTNHLIRLVDDLLEVSRVSRGAFSLRTERVDLSQVIRNALETSEPLLTGAGHELRVDLPQTALLVEGDPMRLTQILANLLNNAATYADAPGRIAVRVTREGELALIRVRDEGMGIDAAALPRLFEMFNRGDRHSARNKGGLGIGLALSRRLAQMHGGSLDAHSEGLGQGSEFTLRLPLATRVAEESGQGAPAATESSAAGADCSNRRPGVVLQEFVTPGMNGDDVARAICAASKKPPGGGFRSDADAQLDAADAAAGGAVAAAGPASDAAEAAATGALGSSNFAPPLSAM